MKILGLLAEFATADALLHAANRARQAEYTKLEAYAPFPVEGLAEAVGLRSNRVPLVTLLGGIAGGTATYFLQWYTAVVDYPINVGGRPLHSWPSFIPPTFEITILGAALAAVIGMLIMNGLPRLHHPLFDVPEFDLATRNRFYLFLSSGDAAFEKGKSHLFLETLHPLAIIEVPA